MLSLVRRLGALRRATAGAADRRRSGSLDAGRDVLAWAREHDGETLVAAVNFAAAAVAATACRTATLVLSTDPDRSDVAGRALAPGEAVLIRLP